MQFKLLGHSGLRVSELCLGAMTFGEEWGAGSGREESRKVFDAFLDAGGNFIDTAVNYTEGTSETFLGDFMGAQRENLVLATKFTGTRFDQKDPNQGGNSRKNMMHSVERSLKRLKTDYLDLYYVHVWDDMTPVEEVMRGLDDLVRSGKVHYVGISDSPSWVASEANMLAELRGWSRFVGYQLPYSLAGRDIERAELAVARHWDMAVLPWGVLDGGLLSGKYASGGKGRRNPSDLTPEKLRIVEAVERVAKDVGRTPSQVALNWVRQQPHAQIIPLVGARTKDQLADNLGALEWQLTPEQLADLTRSGPIVLGFPRDFLEGGVRPYVFGATFDKTEDHRNGRRS